jgi:hypothetical protein
MKSPSPYERETWSLILKEEHRAEGVWEQGAEVNIWTYEGGSGGRLEKLHDEDIHNLWASPVIIMVIKSKGMR